MGRLTAHRARAKTRQKRAQPGNGVYFVKSCSRRIVDAVVHDMLPADFSHEDTARFAPCSLIKVRYFEVTPYLPHSARLTPYFDQSVTSYIEGPAGMNQDFEVMSQHLGGAPKPKTNPVSLTGEDLSSALEAKLILPPHLSPESADMETREADL